MSLPTKAKRKAQWCVCVGGIQLAWVSLLICATCLMPTIPQRQKTGPACLI